MVRIDHLGDDAPQVGDWVQYLNRAQTPDDIASIIGTNGYEILTGLGKRAERIYINSGVDRQIDLDDTHEKQQNMSRMTA